MPSDFISVSTRPRSRFTLNPNPQDPAAGIDIAEFLSAVGTFLATLTAFFSVGIIIFRSEPHIAWTILIGIGWTVGIVMQIVAGAIARAQA